MKKSLSFCLVIALFFSLSGCFISVNDGEYGDGRSGWQKDEQRNRALIADLELNTQEVEIRDLLGTPNFSESFESNGDEYSILFYRTERLHEDGMTTKDESTPLVFRESRLIGWGDTVYSRITRRQIADSGTTN